jgi:hypothetical protein
MFSHELVETSVGMRDFESQGRRLFLISTGSIGGLDLHPDGSVARDQS